MLCPTYDGKTGCEYKSKHFVLSQAHIDTYCTRNPADCAIRKSAQSSAKSRDAQPKIGRGLSADRLAQVIMEDTSFNG